MPAAGVAIAGVLSGVAAAVGSVAAAIAAAVASIAGVIGGVIGSTVAGIAGAIGGAFASIAGVITGVAEGVIAPLADTITGIAGTIANTVTSLSKGLTTAIKGITLPVTKTITEWTGKLNDLKKVVTTVIDGPATAILTPIKETLQSVKGVVDTIRKPVDAILEPVKAMREVISEISSLKIVGEVISGTKSIAELLGPIAGGKAAQTAEAIAQLSKSIAGTTIATMDKIDSEFALLGATIDSFDERIKTSVQEYTELAKAEVLSIVTPRMETLGDNQQMVIKGVARISRHIEDESWFVAMFLRMLR